MTLSELHLIPRMKTYERTLRRFLLYGFAILLITVPPAIMFSTALLASAAGDSLTNSTPRQSHRTFLGVAALLMLLFPVSTVLASLIGLKSKAPKVQRKCARVALCGMVVSLALMFGLPALL